MMRLTTRNASPGDWVVITGHDPADLRSHTITVGGIDVPTFFEADRMMGRCPEVSGAVYVHVDGTYLGSVKVA